VIGPNRGTNTNAPVPASQPSSNPVFTVVTDRVRLRWRPAQARWAHPEGGAPGVTVRVLDGPGVARLDVSTDATALSEETVYAVTVEALGGETVAVRHLDPVVEAAFETLAPGLAHGLVATRSAVGTSRFVVNLDGQPHLAVSVEICPSKLDYRTDFRLLVDDLGRMADDLALAVVGAAYVEAQPEADRPGGPLSRATLLAALVDTLERSLVFAFRQPLRHAAPVPAPVVAHRLRRVQPALAHRLGRDFSETPSRIVQPALVWTFDTPEHRYLAHHLRNAARDARRIARDLPDTKRGVTGRDRMEALADRLDRLGALGLLADLSDAAPPAAMPLRLHHAPGYRDAAHALRLVRQRLSLGAGGRVRAHIKALHRLYEAWAWLAVVEALGAITGRRVPARRLVREDATGTRLRLRVGPSRLAFPAPDGGRLTLRHAPRLDNAPALLAQQPDIVLQHRTPSGTERWLVLDAKYRLDRTGGYTARYGLPGPPVSVLADLHRYRDALVLSDSSRPVTHAAALYPLRTDEAAWNASALARGLQTLGVGAIPVLPGATDALRRFLAEWLTA